MEELLTIKNIIIYVLAINIIAFLAMWIDKKRAENGEQVEQQECMYFAIKQRN